MRSRKSTATLTLVLIGAAALSACGDKPETATRDVYRNAADCKRDWGDDDKKCERQTSGPHSGYFYGPSYGYGRSSTSTSGTSLAPRSGSSAMSSTTVSRGGFGSSSSSHSSSGS
jgi:uncharacterized protein YgiB involved in biofilm formation